MAIWTRTRIGSVIAVALLSAIGASATRAIIPDNPGGSIQFAINTSENVKAISPWIYGTNFDSVPNATINRIGGNRLTGYRWENNASSVGNLADWEANYGPGTFSASTAVPEPSALVLMTGLALIWHVRM